MLYKEKLALSKARAYHAPAQEKMSDRLEKELTQ